MLRVAFDQKQRRLHDNVLVLGGHVEEAVNNSIEVVRLRDTQKTMHLIANSKNIRRKCATIESELLAVLSTQQPMAGDLRTLACLLQVALELERISNHAKEIASINLKLGGDKLFTPISDMLYMARLACSMLHKSLEAFANQDVELARAIPQADDEVDSLYQRIHQELLTSMRVDRAVFGQAVYLSQVGHHLERVADRAINICEWVIFAATGEMKELNTDYSQVYGQ